MSSICKVLRVNCCTWKVFLFKKMINHENGIVNESTGEIRQPWLYPDYTSEKLKKSKSTAWAVILFKI